MIRVGVAVSVALSLFTLSRDARADEAPPPAPQPPAPQPGPYAPPPGTYGAPPPAPYGYGPPPPGYYGAPPPQQDSRPEEIDAAEGTRAPAGYTAVQRRRKGLIIGGSVTFGVSWTISAMAAAVGDDAARSDGTHENELAAMWIPVAGPFIQLASTDSSTGRFFLVGLGGSQLAGAIMLYVGLTSRQTVYVRNDLVGSLRFAPMTPTEDNHYATGMVVGGRF